jgi:hypothetical protein
LKKAQLIKAILAALQAELDTFTRAAQSARAEATDPQSRAEHKYDTRGLEASYLAAGQARQVAELEAAIAAFRTLPVRQFGAGEAIALGALVELERGREQTAYFLGPCAGGTEVTVAKRVVLVITPQSPLEASCRGAGPGSRSS